MSDMSYRWCRTCKQPEYACDCEDPDMEEQSPVARKLANPQAEVWEEDYFFGRKKPPGQFWSR